MVKLIFLCLPHTKYPIPNKIKYLNSTVRWPCPGAVSVRVNCPDTNRDCFPDKNRGYQEKRKIDKPLKCKLGIMVGDLGTAS